MPYTKEHKARTRQRILEEAEQAFREHGVRGVSVPRIMERAGLTHGGFYAHFDSKDALLAEACRSGLRMTSQALAEAAPDAPKEERLAGIVRTYVSTGHRDHPERGCVVPALGAEIARQSGDVRNAFTESFHDFIATLESLLHDDRNEEDAYALAAGMVGAVLMSRAVDDPELSERILSSCQRNLIDTFAS